ncbi:PucR family transcriptional regulator [Actinocrispum wychmicini]|uniref:PucR-like helix-turn-helix protein n=1 Tax=Actinocrispum wychmicini TaxID=1213861 RepID=A0A4R2K717_9PSEU|nr:helix-turn-helix domain-containing protein [Actinocrispum wychmicini]TCO62145.1 PucR-like helix-turn-helix protein [Actinocrispum wychmicini]
MTAIGSGYWRDPLVTRMAKELLAGNADELADRAAEAMFAEIDRYQALNAQQRADVRENIAHVGRGLLTSLANGDPIRTDPVQLGVRLRAAQGMSLGDLLHAHRIGLRIIWDAIIERASADSDIPADEMARAVSSVWSVVDVFSTAVTDAYQDTLVDLARHDERQRLALLDSLIDNRIADWSTLGGTTQALGLHERGSFLCVAADLTDDGSALNRALRRLGMRSVWRPRTDDQVGIASAPARTDIAHVVEALTAVATGRVGVSPWYARLFDTAAALRMAGSARTSLPVGTRGAAALDTNPVGVLVAAAPEIGAHVADSVLAPLLAQPDHEQLLVFLAARLDTKGSTGDVADRLYCHRNTVRNRLDRIEKLTGRSFERPADVAALFAALSAQRLRDRP